MPTKVPLSLIDGKVVISGNVINTNYIQLTFNDGSIETFGPLGSSGGNVPALGLDDLTDVEMSAPQSGQVLTYNGSQWVNQNAGSGGGGTYTLPIASASTLGGIKVGSGLSITGSGVLSTTGGGTTSFGDSSQVWTKYTGSRLEDTLYQNTTGRPILVTASGTGPEGGDLSTCIFISSSSYTANSPSLFISPPASVFTFRTASLINSYTGALVVLVPNNWYYSVSVDSGSLYYWYEFR